MEQTWKIQDHKMGRQRHVEKTDYNLLQAVSGNMSRGYKLQGKLMESQVIGQTGTRNEFVFKVQPAILGNQYNLVGVNCQDYLKI